MVFFALGSMASGTSICISLLVIGLKEGKWAQNLPLSLFLLTFGLVLLVDITACKPLFNDAQLHMWPTFLLYFSIPMLYFHVLQMLSVSYNQIGIHLVPGLFFLLFYLIIGYIRWVFLPAFAFQYIVYSFMLHKQISNLKEFPSIVSYWWIKFVWYSYGAVWVLVLISSGLSSLELADTSLTVRSFAVFLATLFIFGLLYFLINHISLFKKERLTERNLISDSSDLKYRSSRLKKKDILALKTAIQKYLMETKPYLNPEFRLSQMVKDMGLNTNDLSQAINEGFQQNFISLINQYRVEEVKQQLKDPRNKHLTIFAVGLAAGFNSKTTFYTTFKKFTGQTPAQYRKLLE